MGGIDPRSSATDRAATTARQRQAAARREQILETALKLFAERGFDATSTRQIAKEAGHRGGPHLPLLPDQGEPAHRDPGGQAGGPTGLQGPFTPPAGRRGRQAATRGIARRGLRLARHPAQGRGDRRRPVHGGPDEPRSVAGVAGADPRGHELLTGYLASRVEAGELRKDLPLETAATMFVSSLMIFFLARRHLPEPEWREQGESPRAGADLRVARTGRGDEHASTAPRLSLDNPFVRTRPLLTGLLSDYYLRRLP